jgi:hypothetical protein
MTEANLIILIRNVAPQWMIDEMDSSIDERDCVEWWGDEDSYQSNKGWNELDWLNEVPGQDWTDTSKFKNAIKKIDKAIGILVQVKENEEVVTFNGRMRVGQWYYTESYRDLIN